MKLMRKIVKLNDYDCQVTYQKTEINCAGMCGRFKDQRAFLYVSVHTMRRTVLD